jgi:hypothetical protein
MKNNMNNHITFFDITLLYYHGKIGTILDCKCTFGLTEGKKYKRDTRANTSQHEQYRSTVHLFIGTGHSL